MPLMREDFRSLEHFYAANPERERSREVDYGVMWTDGGLNWPQHRVSWVESTGEFYAIRLEAGRGGPVELLGYAEDDMAAEAAMDGWSELDVMRLAWVRLRLERTRAPHDHPLRELERLVAEIPHTHGLVNPADREFSPEKRCLRCEIEAALIKAKSSIGKEV